MHMHHKRLRNASLVEWGVDTELIKQMFSWAGQFPEILERDLSEMSQLFRHWMLVLGIDHRPVQCSNDGEYIVPKNGTFQCVECGRPYNAGRTRAGATLIWTGMLPVQLTGAPIPEQYARRLIADNRLALGHIETNGVLYVLAPITVAYPDRWPNSEPTARYTEGFFRGIGRSVPGTSHDYHMLNDLKMCLFSSWRSMSISEVIKNRIAPHALAQVIIADGRRPQRWYN